MGAEEQRIENTKSIALDLSFGNPEATVREFVIAQGFSPEEADELLKDAKAMNENLKIKPSESEQTGRGRHPLGSP